MICIGHFYIVACIPKISVENGSQYLMSGRLQISWYNGAATSKSIILMIPLFFLE
jgi:hypothetical protein